MLICAHRVNDPRALADLDPEFGVEIDLRSWGDRLILEHDAFLGGPDFEDWLDAYRHAFIVVNIKEEGLEERITAALDVRGITRWAFLDESFPFLVKTLRRGDTRTMVRISEYESVETALALAPRPDWIWVDSFTGEWPRPEALRRLADVGFAFMIVSPELQQRSPEPEIEGIRAAFAAAGVPIDGVCTKRPDLWR
ncbi:MAG: hypothetical protein ABS63_01835 [Microbacterium sp. SCN 70-27]|uniref:hypothetical protein n=1 Tax=unclassified Microbacterium TaxID=2609290 RepID=UPI00086B415A|nr:MULTISPECIES: hypothetical protein [unclassified Microbacterium]MBN9225392.1 hypothetical protein [Microbacterium sp.]ODT29030.1 MAG: hypothetical protein ABS63_01835 [Microbacterium sp. SCN 70-27]